MIFNSFPFAVFFTVFFILYWLLKNSLKGQNLLLLAGSYFFYAWWDWRFLALLAGASLLNYLVGIGIENSNKRLKQKLLLYLALLQGIGGLFYFKYFNFFIDSFNRMLNPTNFSDRTMLNLILPLGISFFTFRMLSYVLDIYHGKIKASRDPIVFFVYVGFFPTLISGPIDKARNFIPQLEKKREFDYFFATEGLRQVLWGLFKKIVIADNCAVFTNQVFDNYETLPASSLLLGTFLYAIQMYSDFSGYSDMAIGFSKMLGLRVARNFEYPFFSRNIAEYWRRWHMSLTTWLTEYVFTPLSISFRDLGKTGLILAIMLNFFVVGIWHGANWTFVVFGLMHGLYFIPLILKGTMNKKHKIDLNRKLPTFKEVAQIIITFILVMFTFVMFRADSVPMALDFYKKMASSSLLQSPELFGKLRATLFFIFLMLVIEWRGKRQEFAIATLGLHWPKILRWSVYYAIILAIYNFAGSEQQFIYFQF